MDFAFIQTATSAAQPAAAIDAAALPAASADTKDAFDAALSASLAIVDKASVRDASAEQDVQLQAPWLMVPVFTVPVAEAAAADGQAASSSGDGHEEGGDVDSSIPAIESAAADVVAAPVIDVPLAAIALPSPVTLQHAAAAGDTNTGRSSTTAAQQGRVYAQLAIAAHAAGVDNAPAVESAATMRPAQSAPTPDAAMQPQIATAAAASTPAAEGVVDHASAQLAAAAPGLTTARSSASATPTPMPAVASARSSVNPAAAAKVSAAVTETGQTVPSAPAVVPAGFEGVDIAVEATPADAAKQAAAAQRPARVNAAVAGVQVGPVVPDVNVTPSVTQVASTPAEVTVAIELPVAQSNVPFSVAQKVEASESAAVSARFGISPQLQFNNDATMTGGDQSSQGQGRRSPEFMRFAAALAHVAPPASEDGARIAVPAVTPSAAPAPAVPSAAPVAAAALVPTAETPDAENVGRLVQAMRINARPGAWEATVRLKPEHLGDVTIALRVERNSVSAVVNAEAAGVRQWLESQEQAVRSGMAEHGLQLERFIVQRDGQRRDHESAPEQESRRRQPRRQPQAAERFEIVV
jgi:flagellar hook-length control protein FliK